MLFLMLVCSLSGWPSFRISHLVCAYRDFSTFTSSFHILVSLGPLLHEDGYTQRCWLRQTFIDHCEVLGLSSVDLGVSFVVFHLSVTGISICSSLGSVTIEFPYSLHVVFFWVIDNDFISQYGFSSVVTIKCRYIMYSIVDQRAV